jgi:hypothetical protein
MSHGTIGKTVRIAAVIHAKKACARNLLNALARNATIAYCRTNGRVNNVGAGLTHATFAPTVRPDPCRLRDRGNTNILLSYRDKRWIEKSSNKPESTMAFIHYSAHAAHRSPLGIVGTDSVIGCAIVDSQDSFIGELRDIMLDLFAGRLAYAVIAVGSRRDDERLIVVPWNALHPDRSVQRLRINAHADWIERAPSLERGYEPDRFAQEWGVFIHNYFGTRPYWEAPASQQYS